MDRKAVEHQPKIGRTRTENRFNINQKQVDWDFGFCQILREFAQIAQNELKNWQKLGFFGEKKKKNRACEQGLKIKKTLAKKASANNILK